MKKWCGLVILVGLLVCCAAPINVAAGGQKMKALQIHWQRLVDKKGQTCDRCDATETAIEEAFKKLKRSLKELDIKVVLEKDVLSPAAFSKDPLESNRIWIAGRPIEEWLSATTGKSRCCSTCGDSECRTLTVDGKTYEAIPAELIIKAGLLAGTQLLVAPTAESCCPSQGSPQTEKSACCSKPAKQQGE